MFEEQYEAWLARQQSNLSGEALRRLNEGHAHNEKLFAKEVWYPALGNFEHLYAEHEVRSYKFGYFYLDFAYIRPPFFIDWEVDDFSSHAKNVTRRSHDYNCDRHNQLVLDGWNVFRISLDAIRERPRQCQQLVLQVMGKLYGCATVKDQPALSLKQREIMRLAFRLQRPFTPTEVCICLGIKEQHARALLHELVTIGQLAAASGSFRIRTFTLGPQAQLWQIG